MKGKTFVDWNEIKNLNVKKNHIRVEFMRDSLIWSAELLKVYKYGIEVFVY